MEVTEEETRCTTIAHAHVFRNGDCAWVLHVLCCHTTTMPMPRQQHSPITPLSGVRISWLTLPRKRLFAFLAPSSVALAAARSLMSSSTCTSRPSQNCHVASRQQTSKQRKKRMLMTTTVDEGEGEGEGRG